MKKTIPILITALMLSSAVAGSADPAKHLTGSWLGTLDVGATKLRVVFNITQSAAGELTATMDSLDQGARGIPVDSVTVNDTKLRMEVNTVNGMYEGVLDAAAGTTTGQWTQGPQSFPLNLARSSAADVAAGEALSPADLAASKAAALKIAGTWNGSLAAGGANLRLRLNIARSDTGAAAGTMDSVDQGANGIPLSVITLKDGKVRFEVRGIGGLYEGTLADDGTTLTGQWHQGGQSLPLEFQKTKPHEQSGSAR